METFTHTDEILKHLKNLHRQLREHYEQGCSQVNGKRVRMLFDEAQRQQEEILAAVVRFQQQTAAEEMKAHFQYTPKALDQPPFDLESLRPDLTADEAARLIAGHLSAMIKMYGRLGEMSANSKVAEVFRSLEQQLRAMRDRLAHSSQQMKDI
jgi:predicted nucleotidyltransferase